MQQTIKLKDLSIGYSNKKAVKVVAQGLNTVLYRGELCCLLGVNGIGKSTLLKTLSGFLKRLDGDILVEGRHIDSIKEKELAKRISVVLTEKVMVHNLSVRELIAMGRSPYNDFWGRISKADEQIVNRCMEMVNICKLAERYVNDLSDGERQKVMIAKALAQDTPIILLDEPTAFLDFPSKVEIIQLLHKLTRQTNKTIFLSTHDLELALQSADKLWLMDKNSRIHIGTPEDLSLDGTLNHFFSKKGVIFDERAGLFRIQNQSNTAIVLEGDRHSTHYLMMQKALLRNGIKADSQQKSPYRIGVHDTSFVWQSAEGETHHCQSIGEVLTYVLGASRTNHLF